MSQFLFKRFPNCLTAVIFGSCSAKAVVQPLLLRALEDFLKVTPKTFPQKWLYIPPILNKKMGGSAIFLWFLEDIIIWCSARLTHLPGSEVARTLAVNFHVSRVSSPLERCQLYEIVGQTKCFEVSLELELKPGCHMMWYQFSISSLPWFFLLPVLSSPGWMVAGFKVLW